MSKKSLYFNKTKKFFSLCLFLFFLPTAWAQKDYKTTYQLTCGPTKVTISNTCAMLTEYDPFCSRQEIEFFNTNSGKTTKQVYLPKWFDFFYTQGFAGRWACLKDQKSYFIIAESTDYGSCHTCEWNDIFDINGKYLGSNIKGYTHALSRAFKKFQFPHKFYNIDDDNRIITSIIFSRTQPKQE